MFPCFLFQITHYLCQHWIHNYFALYVYWHVYFILLLVHICFLWSDWYIMVISFKSLWSNTSSTCSLFNHNILSLPAIVSIAFLPYVLLLMITIFIQCIQQKFQNFLFLLPTHCILSIQNLVKKIRHVSIKDLEIRIK